MADTTATTDTGVTAAKPDKLRETLAELERGITTLATTPAWTDWLRAQSLFHQYSWSNVLLITRQRPEATRVAGFTTWKRLGRSVRKGEHGIAILAPIVIRSDDLDTAHDQARSTRRASTGIATAFRVVRVFDIDQTDGEELPTAPSHPLEGSAPEGAYEGLARAVAQRGFTLATRELPGTCHGTTNFADRTVTLDPGLSPAQRIKTLAHELGHVILHDPSTGGAVISDCRDIAELEAESVAYVVSHHLGVDSGEYSFGYYAEPAVMPNRIDARLPPLRFGLRLST